MPLGQGSINGPRNVFMFGPPEDADENYIEIQSHAPSRFACTLALINSEL